MEKKSFLKKYSLLITIIIDLLFVISVFTLMPYVQHLLENDVKVNLTEIVTQNKDVISSKLKVEVNNLDLIANQIADRYTQISLYEKTTLEDVFVQYANEKEMFYLFYSSPLGTATFYDRTHLNILGRQYFQYALSGKPNISERTLSRKDGDEIFIISTPIKIDGQIVGTIQRQFTVEEMAQLCAISLFSEQGNMSIINSSGYVLIDSKQSGELLQAENYYRSLFYDNPEQSRKIQSDILENKSGFMETTIDDVKYFSAYTPIEDVFDWYLITSVSTETISGNANTVIRLFYIILFSVALFFGVLSLYLYLIKKKQQERLKKIAFVDTVTGGNTLARFIYDLQNILYKSPSTSYALLAFDIDNFSYINNYYGFDTGDLVLKEIQARYSIKLSGKEFIARTHTDHFIVLLEDYSPQRLASLFVSEEVVKGVTIYLSAGLYHIVDAQESINLMIDKANLAARKVKGLRNKRIEVYSKLYDQQMIENEQMKRSIELAIENDEILPYFQPKVNIEDRTLVGAEALARWITPDHRVIPPDQFIPICERTGLIEVIDMTIFEKTLQFLNKNRQAGITCVPISVNFSRVHLTNENFVPTLLEKMKHYNISAELIEIELTETVIFDNHSMIANLINKLHSHQLIVSMDDFGSGYSSLHLLKDIDIDVLKIDRGFLNETNHSDRQKTIFEAITRMAKKLKISIVVEGVETTDNVALMKEFGCIVAQGYYYSRPICLEEFDSILKKGKL